MDIYYIFRAIYREVYSILGINHVGLCDWPNCNNPTHVINGSTGTSLCFLHHNITQSKRFEDKRAAEINAAPNTIKILVEYLVEKKIIDSQDFLKFAQQWFEKNGIQINYE